MDNVNAELLEKGVSKQAIEKLQPIIRISGSNEEKLEVLKEELQSSEIGKKGIEETETIFEYLKSIPLKLDIELDLTLARGLNYYTGAIFEVKAKGVEMGSISGGGRYDNLTGVFGLQGVSGVGISFGADRIYDVLNALDLYPKETAETTKVLFVCFGEDEVRYVLPYVKQVREAGISAEIYPTPAKMKKQLGYADSKRIPYAAIIGEEEKRQNKFMLKDMESGEQTLVTLPELIATLK